MTSKEYQKIKSKIDKLLQEAETQAKQEGIDITSPDFDSLLERLKEKIVRQYGIDYQEYLAMEEETEKTNPNESLVLSMAKEMNNDRTSDFKKEVIKAKDWFSQEVMNLKTNFDDYKNEVNVSISGTQQSINKKIQKNTTELLQIIGDLSKSIDQKTTEQIKKDAKYRDESQEQFNKNLEELKEELINIQSYNLDNYDEIKKLREASKGLLPKDFQEKWKLLTSGQLADALHKHDIKQRRGYGGIDEQTVRKIISESTVGTHNLLSSSHSDTTAGTVTRGDLITGQGATTTWQRLALGAANRILRSDGTDASWAQVALSTDVTGTLPVGNGGTGQISYTDGQLLIGNSTGNTLNKSTLTGTANQITITNGGGSITLATPQNTHTAATPTFASLTLTAASSLTLGTASTNTGAIVFKNSTNANTLTLQSGATGGALTFTFPSADGTSGQVIQTNGSGTLSFVTVSTAIGANPTASVGLTAINGTSANFLRSDGAPALSQSIAPTWTGAHAWTTSTTPITITQGAASSGSPTGLSFAGGAHTTLAASAEATDINFNLARTVQFATGALTTQRAVRIQAPTYGFVGASTLTTAATMEISGAPIAGTNATITNAYALRINAGQATAVAEVVKGAASQTANLTEWQNSSGTVLASISSAGLGSFTGLTNASGTVTFSNFSTNGGLLYTNGSGVLSQTGAGTSTTLLHGGITPAYSAVSLTADVSGTLPVANGGTGQTSYTDGQLLVGNSTGNTLTKATLTGTSNQITVTNGSGSITLSTPQSIATTSTPQFLRLGVGAAADNVNLLTFTQAAASSGSPSALVLAGGAHTTLTASTEATDVNFNLARTVQFATGALTTQRAFLVQAPTYGFVAASTITDAATLAISGAPVAGTNATITNPYALWVQGGTVNFAGTNLILGGGTVIKPSANSASAINFTKNDGTTSILNIDSTNARVGIGTTAPLSPLMFLNTLNALTANRANLSLHLQKNDATNNTGTGIGFGVTTDVSAGGPVGAKIIHIRRGTNSQGDLAFYTKSTTGGTDDAEEKVRIMAAGEVGIGTTSPVAGKGLTIAPAARTSGSPSLLTITGPADTTLTASTEAIDINFNLARTVQFATGALTTERAFLVQAPTYAFVAASTLTTAVTMEITGAPIAGTNATLTNAYSLRVNAGQATAIPLVVKAAASPTASLTEWQNSSGTVLSRFDQTGILLQGGGTRTTADFNKTNDTVLANITGLSVNVVAAKTYKFEAILNTTSNTANGVNFAIAGTATATAIVYEALVFDNTATSAQTRATALATSVGAVTAVSNALCHITGTITVNAAGTLTVQFAQNVSGAASSSVLTGSTFTVHEIT